MLQKISLLLLLVFTSTSWSSDLTGKSARREPGTSYRAYMARAHVLARRQQTDLGASALDEAKRYGTIKSSLPAVTIWESEEAMTKAFRDFRDLRFLDDLDQPNFKRRSTWLYPDDGCFARASLAILNLGRANYALPKKVFVFGDLKVETANSPDGEVTWWYHVAPLVEVEGEKYVLDPAIQASGPIKLDDWLATMTDRTDQLEVAICDSGSYTPYDPCYRESDGVEALAITEQGYYLSPEWERLRDLGRDPEKELGDLPPWLETTLP